MSIHAGSEIQVNSYTTSNQAYPHITTLADGGWVVTWRSDGQDGSGDGVYQQAYHANGSVQDGEVRVNTYTNSHQDSPQITALTDGGWVVAWLSSGQDGSGYGVYQQAYHANGSVSGGEVRVNTHTPDWQYNPQITALTDGGWVVTWHSYGQDEAGGYGVYQQAYHANGSVQDGEVRVNTYTTNSQYSPQITALADGGWVVTWTSDGQDGSGYGVYQQAYHANGSVQDGEVRVNTWTASDQYYQRITALADGGWVVTWQSDGQDGSGAGVYQQAYNANGSVQNGETQVNTWTDNYQGVPQITALADDGWVVTWQSNDQDGSGSGVYQQAYNDDGSVRGSETQVNTHTNLGQTNPQITALADGGWVVTWISYGQDEADSYGVYQQAYNASGSVRGGETQVNTYTAEDQSAPQISALAEGGWVVTWMSEGQDGDSRGVYQRVFQSVEDHRLTGSAASDRLAGDWGKDILIGKGGNDVLKGVAGNDTLKGGGGKDVLKGGSGNDKLFGDSGHDRLFGDGGRDVLNGGGGNDKLVGHKGNDILKGQGGRDVFVFKKKDGTDLVKDFQDGKDKLDLKAFGFANKNQALKQFEEWGKANDDKVKFDHKGTIIKIKGVDLSDIGGGDILI